MSSRASHPDAPGGEPRVHAPAGNGSTRGVRRSPYHSASYLRALAQAERFARDRNAAVLLEGESGTGKTQLARHLHDASPRSHGPFQTLVLSALDDALAGSELFGHVSGAFTDARYARTGRFLSANGGTLFLDEIGKASLAIQQKLLHVVEYGEIRPIGSDRDIHVDVRIVAATNLSLASLVATGRFLPDLEARLGVFRVQLPPLRERRADIPLLVAESVARHAVACGFGNGAPRVAESLMAALIAAPWPNNLRQLDATIHRLLVDAEGMEPLTLDHCIDDLAYLRARDLSKGTPVCTLSAARIDAAIARAGSVSGAARLMGVDRSTIYRFRSRTTPASDG